MLKLFQSIFGGGEARGRYPASLVDMAIERAVDGSDARLRALSVYRKRLREPVIHAIDQVLALVEALPAPVPAAVADYSTDPRIRALFVSPDHMREVLGNDPALSAYREQAVAGSAEPVFGLLLAERREKRVFGLELAGDTVQRDVAQVTVSFTGHRLVDIASDEETLRRALRRRAFDHLIALALARISEMKGERLELGHQRELLRAKLATLNRGGWSFDDQAKEGSDPAALQAELDDIERQLAGSGKDVGALDGELDILVETLAGADKQLWVEAVELHLDRMNVKRAATDESVSMLRFGELHNARGQSLIMLLVALKPDELPRRGSFSENVARALAELGGR